MIVLTGAARRQISCADCPVGAVLIRGFSIVALTFFTAVSSHCYPKNASGEVLFRASGSGGLPKLVSAHPQQIPPRASCKDRPIVETCTIPQARSILPPAYAPTLTLGIANPKSGLKAVLSIRHQPVLDCAQECDV